MQKKLTAKKNPIQKKLLLSIFGKNLNFFFFTLAIILISTLCLSAYSPVFKADFVGDDFDFIVNWDQIRDFDHLASLLAGDLPPTHQGTYRPFRSLVYLLSFRFLGVNPTYHHLLILTIHTINGILVYLLAKKITASKPQALSTSLLFALHPINTESIAFITAGYDTFSTLFFLASFLLFIGSKKSPKIYLLSLLYAFLSIFSHELGLLIPVIFSLYLRLIAKKTLKKTLQITKPFYLLALGYLGIRFFLLDLPIKQEPISYPWHTNLITSVKSLFLYLKQLFLPLKLSLDHQLPDGIFTFYTPETNYIPIASQAFFSSSTLIPFFLIILATAFIMFAKDQTLRFAYLWLLTSLLPTLSLFPGSLIFSERYAYFASIGFCLFVVFLLNKIPKKLSLSLIFLILLFYSIKTHSRSKVWQNDLTLWQTTASQSPQNPVVWWQLGKVYHKQSQFPKAVSAYERSLSLDSNFHRPLEYLVGVYLQNNPPKALPYLEKLTQLYPENSQYQTTFKQLSTTSSSTLK